MIKETGDFHLAGHRKPKLFYGYIVVGVTFLILVVMFGTFYSFGIFFKPLSAEFGWTRAITSGAFSLCLLLFGFLSIITGRLSDRFGPKIVVTACGFILGLGHLLMSQIGAIWQLYLFYGVMMGIGMSGGFVPLVSTVARWFAKRRGIMTGIVVAGIGVGIMTIPPITSWLIASYGWRTSYIIVGIITLVLLVPVAQFLKRDPGQMARLPYGENGLEEKGLGLQARGFSLKEAVHMSQFWMFFAMMFCFGIFLNIIMVHIVPHATELGISATGAANILPIIGGLSIAGRITMGSGGDRIGNKSALIINFILISVALLWLLAAREVWMLYLFALIFGFAYGGIAALESPVTAELFGLSSLGAIMGILAFGFAIGGAIGPVVAGSIFDMTGSYQLAFLICATISVITIILTSLLKPASTGGSGNDPRRSP